MAAEQPGLLTFERLGATGNLVRARTRHETTVRKIDPDDGSKLGEAIDEAMHLQAIYDFELDVSHYHLCAQGASELAASLKHTINLANAYDWVTSPGFTLRALRLTDTNLEDAGLLTIIMRLLRPMGSRLRELVVPNNGIRLQMPTLQLALYEALTRPTSPLVVLVLSNNQLSNGGFQKTMAHARSANLKELHLNMCSLDLSSIRMLAEMIISGDFDLDRIEFAGNDASNHQRVLEEIGDWPDDIQTSAMPLGNSVKDLVALGLLAFGVTAKVTAEHRRWASALERLDDRSTRACQSMARQLLCLARICLGEPDAASVNPPGTFDFRGLPEELQRRILIDAAYEYPERDPKLGLALAQTLGAGMQTTVAPSASALSGEQIAAVFVYAADRETLQTEIAIDKCAEGDYRNAGSKGIGFVRTHPWLRTNLMTISNVDLPSSSSVDGLSESVFVHKTTMPISSEHQRWLHSVNLSRVTAHRSLRKMGRFELREAEPRDIPALLGLIRELAEYERMPEMVKATPELLQRNIFERHFGSAVVAVDTRNASRVVGMALWTTTFSTWTGKPSLYLEDLYVQPEARKHGLGKALFGWLGKKCRELDCARLEWVVLKWNEPSIKFYEALGATTMKDWDTMRLEGTALADLEKLLPS